MKLIKLLLGSFLCLSVCSLFGCSDTTVEVDNTPETESTPIVLTPVTVGIIGDVATRTSGAFDNNQPIVIIKNTTVIWINNDTKQHTVTSDDNEWDSGNLEPGQRFERNFPKDGTFAYFCKIHQDEQGRVIVQGATPTPSPSPSPSPFTPTPSPMPSLSPAPTPLLLSSQL